MNNPIRTDIDWPSFLSRHDPLWKTKPLSWDDGVFLGNGMLGAMVYGEEHRMKRNVLRFVLGRCDVTSKRPGGEGFPVRVPIGELALELEGWIYQPCEIRLDLWEAELRALITTTKGYVKLTAFIHALSPVLAVEAETDQGERGARFQWYAYPEVDPILKNSDGINLSQPIPEIEVQHVSEGGLSVGVQSYGADQGCTTVWKAYTVSNNPADGDGLRKQICLVTVSNGISGEIQAAARSEIEKVPLSDPEWDSWVQAHRNWWHDYYPASFVSVPDTPLEAFIGYRCISLPRQRGRISFRSITRALG